MKKVESLLIFCFWVALFPVALLVAGVAFLFGVSRADVEAMEANGHV